MLAMIIDRMLKKPASVVLASFSSSTYRLRFSEIGSTGGVFPFAKIYLYGRTAPQSAVGTSSGLHSLRPRWTAFLSILHGHE
jgi:hypothetical protein